MKESSRKRLAIAYIVVAILVAVSMGFSASGKLTHHPGAVHTIHEVVGVPLSLFPLLAGLEIAGGIGILVGIFWPPLGVAGAAGLVLYFVGAIVAHVRVADWDGVTAPITPLLFAIATLVLRIVSMRRRT
jgi:uncharacterized membrane protein YphA (DoxX/SURF4 family)